MKRLVLLLTWTSAVHAGTPADKQPVAPAPLPPPGYAPITLLDGRLTIDIQEKMRFEARENNFDFDDSVNGPQDASWLLQRFRLGIGYSITPWLKVYVQGQDIREIGGSRPNEVGVLGAEGDDTFDVLKAYIQAGDLKKGVSATLGRQFLSYGDQRLIGPLEWLNGARTFDAIKLRYAQPAWSLELFTASPVNFKDHMWNQSDFLDNDEVRNSILSGAYFSMPTLVPWQSVTDLYVFHKMEDKTVGAAAAGPPVGAVGDSNFWTLGMLMKGDPKKLNGWDYSMEMAYQFGKAADLDHSAFAGNWGFGYNFKHPWKPRLGVQYSFASGDSNPLDGDSETFQNLYPTNHLFYGYMDTASWQNIHNPEVNFSIMPTPKLKLMLDYHAFWNETNSDLWYRANAVTPVRAPAAAAAATDNFRGHEIDLTATYKLNPHVGFMAGYSLFIAGNYLAQTGASDNAHFGYVQVQIDF
jgi:hypothetical protein